MEGNFKGNLINLHCHIFETKEYNKANFTPHQFLSLQKALSELFELKVITNCGGHNSTTLGKLVWDEYNKYPDLKDSVELFPESEFSADVSKIFRDSPFNKIHLLAAAKKGMEDMYFANTAVFSVWSDMYISKDISKGLKYIGEYPKSEDDRDNYINVGTMMIAARNTLCQKYCKDYSMRIPFEVYEDTLEFGLTYNEIRERFVEDSFKYLASKGLIENTEEAKSQLYYDINFTHKYSVQEKIENFTKEVISSINERHFMKANNAVLPKDLFDEVKRPGISFDVAKEKVIRKLYNYLIINKFIDMDDSTKEKLSLQIGEIAKTHKRMGLVPLFLEITPEEIKIAQDTGKNRFRVLFGHPSTRLDLKDISLLFGDTAYFCLAHPNEEKFRADAKIPVSYFDKVDISSLPKNVQDKINDKLWYYVRTGENYYFSPEEEDPIVELLTNSKGETFLGIIGDNTGIVKDEMLINFLDRVGKYYNFNLDGVEISKRMFYENKENKNLHAENAWEHYDMYVKHQKAINCVSGIGDIHYNFLSDIALLSDTMSRKKHQRNFNDDLTFVCDKCSWYDLIKNGTFDKENQDLSVKIRRQFLNKKYQQQLKDSEKNENE
ncbi:MAG TPA: hypothetical protein DCO89_02360 [Clostridiales bacterium]|nr:hypothetical protein [Clostridiales bacterium]